MDGLIYLMQMLMREGLVDGDIVVAPGEMGGCTWFLSCSCASGDAVGVYVAADNPCFQCRQESQLDSGGKASWIGQMHARAYFLPVCLGQSVHIVVLSSYTKVLCQIDNPYMAGYRVLLQEGSALSVSKAEENHIHLAEGHLSSEAHVSLSHEPFVHVTYQIARVALTVGKHYFGLRVIDEQANEFATCVACCSQYSYSYHTFYLSSSG